MTVRINFLPRHYQPPKQLGAKEWALAVACAAAVLATGGYYSSVYAGTVSLERQNESDSLQLKTVQAKLVEAQEIKTREARVTAAELDLKSLSGHRWSGVLLTLSQLTPKTISWASLKTSGNDIALKGTSRGLVDMAQLLGGLITEPSVNQVTLKTMSEKGIPVTVTVKAGDQTGVVEGIKSLQDLGMVRQMEFELVITLMPAEGRQLPHGA